MNAVERLEFELAYYDVAVQHVSQYATGTLSTFSVWHPGRTDQKT